MLLFLFWHEILTTPKDHLTSAARLRQDRMMRIFLRLSLGAKLLGLVIVTGALLFVVAAVLVLVTSASLTEGSAGGFALIVFGWATLLGIRRLTCPPDEIEIRPEGVLLWCHSLTAFSGALGGFFPWGFADWRNLDATGVVRAFGNKCLAIRLKDPNAFIATRKTLGDRDRPPPDRLQQRSGKFIMTLSTLTPLGKFMELIMMLLGYSGLPKSTDDNDAFAWNLDNYNWHILIPGLVIPDSPEALHQLIEQHRPHPSAQRLYGPEKVEIPGGEPNRSAESRLAEVDELLRNGLITEEEYRRKREEILSGI